MVLSWLVRKSPRGWWLWFWAAAVPIQVFIVFIAPVSIAPLSYDFEPLAQSNPALVAQLERVVEHGGLRIPHERIYLMKASDKVVNLNAYVAGIGARKRIVVWDNTLKRATPDEIAFIFGHEMGHYVLHHVLLGLALNFLLQLVIVWAGYHAQDWLIARFGRVWRIPDAGDWAAFAVLTLLFFVLSFVAEPVKSGIGRAIEHSADVYGQEAIHGIVADPQQTARRHFKNSVKCRSTTQTLIGLPSFGFTTTHLSTAGMPSRATTTRGRRMHIRGIFQSNGSRTQLVMSTSRTSLKAASGGSDEDRHGRASLAAGGRGDEYRPVAKRRRPVLNHITGSVSRGRSPGCASGCGEGGGAGRALGGDGEGGACSGGNEVGFGAIDGADGGRERAWLPDGGRSGCVSVSGERDETRWARSRGCGRRRGPPGGRGVRACRRFGLFLSLEWKCAYVDSIQAIPWRPSLSANAPFAGGAGIKR